MVYTILDCYTDEPAGLGVPPYIGTYPRYLYGYLASTFPNEKIYYITIDDLRMLYFHNNKKKETLEHQKTDIRIYNLTKNSSNIQQVLAETEELFVIVGVQVPGKYLTALPGTMHEVSIILKHLNLKCKKILTGPAVFGGTQLVGGKFFEKIDYHFFNKKERYNFTYEQIKEYAVKGAEIVKQIINYKIIEIETGKGCNVGKCSFCTEPLKAKVEYRKNEDVVEEVKAYYDLGERYFRLGKQTCFYSLPDPICLLKSIRTECPEIKVLHIDNVNPIFVGTKIGEEITKAIVQYCSAGNIAAHGIESFDSVVAKENLLNCNAEMALKAIRMINKYGAERGENGMPKFLPGINIIFGLKWESKKTHTENMKYLQQILDEGLLLRRINIRQAALFEGTKLYEDCGDKFLKKNRKYYWKWRNEIRQKIDFVNLQKLVPKGTVLKDVIAEIYDGKTTFMRQIGTYPLIVGVNGRYPMHKFYTIRVTDHMLRSISGEVVCQQEKD